MRGLAAWTTTALATAGAAVLIALAGVAQGFVALGSVPTRPAPMGLRRISSARRVSAAPAKRTCGSAMRMHQVTIEHDGKSTVLEVDEGTTILDAALDNEIELPHDCKLGVCLTCPSLVVSGSVDQSDGTLDDSVVEQGFALTCCTYPRSDVVIRSVEEDEMVGAQFSDRT